MHLSRTRAENTKEKYPYGQAYGYGVHIQTNFGNNLSYTGKPLTGTLTNSEDQDPDEMQHDAAFHQDLHCLLRLKQPSGT